MSDTRKLTTFVKSIAAPYGYERVPGSGSLLWINEGGICRVLALRKVDSQEWVVHLIVSIEDDLAPEDQKRCVAFGYYLNREGVVYDQWGQHETWSLDEKDELQHALVAYGIPLLDEIGTPEAVVTFLEKLHKEGHPKEPEPPRPKGLLGRLLVSEMKIAEPLKGGVPNATWNLAIVNEKLGEWEKALHYAESYRNRLCEKGVKVFEEEKQWIDRRLERLRGIVGGSQRIQ